MLKWMKLIIKNILNKYRRIQVDNCLPKTKVSETWTSEC